MLNIATLLIALTALGAPQETFEKSKHPWMKWKEGAIAKYKMTYKAGAQNVEGTLEQKLSKVTDKEYTITGTSEMMGQTQNEEESESIGKKDGEETLTIDGQKTECVIWKSTGKKGEQSTESKMWVPKGKDIPMKWVTKSDKEEIEVTAVKTGEKVSAGGKEIECVRLEGKIKASVGEGKATLWYSPAVPGGAVKMEIKVVQGEDQTVVTIQLTEYKADKP